MVIRDGAPVAFTVGRKIYLISAKDYEAHHTEILEQLANEWRDLDGE